MNKLNNLEANGKTVRPPRVYEKRAKGRRYLYFNTGLRDADGKRVLQRLPAADDPDFDRALAEANLERWRRANRSLPLTPILPAPLTGDDLYFMRAGDAVKIGRTTNVARRMAAMQANNAADVDCICTLPGRGKDEKEWHTRFAHLRIRGEWFQWVPELAEAIVDARRSV